MHLTNYAINKKNDHFVQNENAEEDDFGYKWSLGAFCQHLLQVGIDLDLLWSRIYDVIIKTILCGENYVVTAMRKSRVHRTNCFEMLGFDILIDSDLKPWLIEVNLSSSMATESPLDLKIKSNLMCDTFNLIGIKKAVSERSNSVSKQPHQSKANAKQGYKSSFGTGIQDSGKDIGLTSEEAEAELYHMIDRLGEQYPHEYAILNDPLKKASKVRW